MICRKCRTVYPNDENACPKCHTRSDRSSRPAVISGIVGFALIAAVCGAYIYYHPDISAYLGASAPPAVSSAPAVSDIPQQGQTAPSEAPEVSAKPKDTAVTLQEISAAAEKYSQRHQGSDNFVSMGGYLFDMQKNAYVSVDDLIADELLSSIYGSEAAYLLYLKPRDISAYPEIDLGGETSLRLVTAIETPDGVALLMDDKQGMIHRENYMLMLEGYNQDGGEVLIPGADDEAFAGIVAGIENGSIDQGDLDLRYVSHDERYAYALASIKPETSALYGFAFIRGEESGEFELVSVYQGADAANYVVFNAEYPDFNPKLIPDLNVGQYAGSMISDFEPYLAYLSENALLDAELEPVTYAAGAGAYVYIKTDRRAFLLSDSGDGIAAEEISSTAEAAALMRALTGRPPLFILPLE